MTIPTIRGTLLWMKDKILLLSDDIRGSSGVSHISRSIITQLVGKYDWVQMAAMQRHPENNTIVDVSKSVSDITGVDNCYVRLYPCSGYGDELSLKNIINMESPSAILHMSDPRNFTWLYDIDIDIRSQIPMCYYHVWDNEPTPVFNEYVYKSCDWIGAINKITKSFVDEISRDTEVSYVPHGVSPEIFRKLGEEVGLYKSEILGRDDYDYVIFANNVNIPRKQLPTLIESVGLFADKNTTAKICLLMHNNPSSVSSENLKIIANKFCQTCDVVFSETTLEPHFLNIMYNISDVTINIASNEGFGLSTLESVMAGTPIIATNTGGLSDQMFHSDGSRGEWAYPITPDIRRLASGGNVPYIYDDLCSTTSVVEALEFWHGKTSEERTECGLLGRANAVKNFGIENMIGGISSGLTNAIKNFKPIQAKKVIKV